MANSRDTHNHSPFINPTMARCTLPKSHRVHWSDARKADVVQAVHDRSISFHEARQRYLLSRDEFEQWEAEFPPKSPAQAELEPA